MYKHVLVAWRSQGQTGPSDGLVVCKKAVVNMHAVTPDRLQRDVQNIKY